MTRERGREREGGRGREGGRERERERERERNVVFHQYLGACSKIIIIINLKFIREVSSFQRVKCAFFTKGLFYTVSVHSIRMKG